MSVPAGPGGGGATRRMPTSLSAPQHGGPGHGPLCGKHCFHKVELCVLPPGADAAGLGYSGESSPQSSGMRTVQILKENCSQFAV